MKKIIAALVVVSVLFFNANAFAGNFELDFSEAKPFNAALRSVLMPGWGQGWNEQPVKGWITFGLFAAAVGGAFYFNGQANNKYNEYKTLGAIDGNLYNDYETNYNTSTYFTYGAIAVWLYAVIDAYFTCQSQIAEGGAAKKSAFNVGYDQNRSAYMFNYSHKI
ncbi:DUF5683 domain-containing protein [Endomicrobium proavitum]|uniref:DUF5683 domain-containing protein n=1 Tax=Endomicrobium proavitum TaxID=1408281 RepID=A0A0G3WJF2_9BACT|nr:DUF5683 domain-containing protein [Endomicrobium proavitum]AKL97995.1 exported protein of unknown function [Endomicrobium proavitum]